MIDECRPKWTAFYFSFNEAYLKQFFLEWASGMLTRQETIKLNFGKKFELLRPLLVWLLTSKFERNA